MLVPLPIWEHIQPSPVLFILILLLGKGGIANHLLHAMFKRGLDGRTSRSVLLPLFPWKVVMMLANLVFSCPNLSWNEPTDHVELFAGVCSITKGEWEEWWQHAFTPGKGFGSNSTGVLWFSALAMSNNLFCIGMVVILRCCYSMMTLYLCQFSTWVRPGKRTPPSIKFPLENSGKSYFSGDLVGSVFRGKAKWQIAIYLIACQDMFFMGPSLKFLRSNFCGPDPKTF